MSTMQVRQLVLTFFVLTALGGLVCGLYGANARVCRECPGIRLGACIRCCIKPGCVIRYLGWLLNKFWLGRRANTICPVDLGVPGRAVVTIGAMGSRCIKGLNRCWFAANNAGCVFAELTIIAWGAVGRLANPPREGLLIIGAVDKAVVANDSNAALSGCVLGVELVAAVLFDA